MKVTVELDTQEILNNIEYALDTYRIENTNFHDVQKGKTVLEVLNYVYDVIKDTLENLE